ncbi:MAG: NAD(P)-dependent oxidoreductase [Deltaproteobacteria bacterium]|nr:NAD(P)-dependent oxidoreductase [Deltaproteobacteria bacterium]
MSEPLGTVLLTGATGFIGSALADRLEREARRTIALVLEDDPRQERLRGRAGIELALVPRASRDGVARALGSRAPDVVFHLAAAGVSPHEREPVALVDGNVGLTTSVLAALGPQGAGRFVHTGSCAEYAPAPPPVRIGEEHPLGPTSLYGAAKAAAYLCGKALAAELGIPFVALRLFGVYGPGEAPERLVPYLLASLRAAAVPALTAGEQARDLTCVDDVVDAIVLAARAPALASGGTCNVCSGNPVRVREVAELVAREAGFPEADLGLGRRPYHGDEPMWLVGDPARLAATTGWRPRISLPEGIRRMVAATGQERA